ncbi:nucleotide pyrophosphohydrolase [Flavobacterium noncentrifugens]|uniref:NTP pyrophosphatase, house-cleaning of non-canonical NTPs n=1 Tax=Flavobacterium noncentrifugens TaxID=1128970 RepID=A0A1G8ZGJ8_9FLAO|nr:nucleotide pyrophosphohydrolase [Flavobacterium noncentrifugens]GEP51961.1 nucleotide pyrophosphohydrolase [Flavobacterium noncentrifugens]SDK13724.1 NTP pyrophosphatase, house-cleaning of non-canonical NTPs [Flavobacterium noncentrifugens]
MDKYKKTIEKLIEFRNDRDWQQFHDSKNLALAISIEAAELNELFLWKKETESDQVNIEKLKEELADVLSFSLLLAEKHQLDIFDIVLEKIEKNGEKYPVAKAKGTAKKYDEL